MDTRKLEAIASQDRRTRIVQPGGPTIAVGIQDNHEDAEELVRRWNAYPELLESLRTILSMHTGQFTVGSVGQLTKQLASEAIAKATGETL